jgi:hypothetical protein
VTRGLAFAAVVALAGCKSPPAARPDAAPPDAAPDAGIAITGRELVRQIANDVQHLPQVTDVPRHMVAMTAIAPDNTATPVAVGSDGSFAFTSASPDVRLAVVRDGAPPVEYQVRATHLDLGEALAGRYDRVAPGAGTSLAVTTTGSIAGGAVVDTTGLWTQTAQPQGTSSASFTLDWTKATSLSGPIGLVDSSANDQAFVAFFNGVAGGYIAVNEACPATELTMMDAMPNQLSCASAALPLDRCVQAAIGDADEYQRLAAALPATLAYTGGGALWYVAAVPAPQLGPVGALWLAFGGTQSPPTTNLSQAISFANPFPGHTPVLAWTVYRARTLLLPGTTTGAPLTASTTYIVAPTASCPTPTAVTGNAAIAAPPALDGLALDHDGLTAALDRSQPHAITWDLAAAGAVDTWMVNLYRVTATGTQTQAALERSYVTTERSVAIDPADLAAGQTYVIELDAFQAYPNAAAGDFRTLGFPAAPYAESSTWSGSFEISE